MSDSNAAGKRPAGASSAEIEAERVTVDTLGELFPQAGEAEAGAARPGGSKRRRNRVSVCDAALMRVRNQGRDSMERRASWDPLSSRPWRPTRAVVVLGFLRKTVPPYSMQDRDKEYAEAGATTALENRLELAREEYAKDATGTAVIVTGGDMQKLGRTEADFMACWLQARGVAFEHIRREEDARHTIENGSNVRLLVEELRVRHVVLVTNTFHMQRSAVVFRWALPEEVSLEEASAPDGAADAMLAETGKPLEVWQADETKALQLRNLGNGDGPVGSVLHERLRAYSKLSEAVKGNNMQAAESLVRSLPNGVDGDVGRGGAVALHYAVLWGSLRFTQMLLNAGASPNRVNLNNCTPLHFATFARHCTRNVKDELAALLVANGAEDTVPGTSGLWKGAQTAAALMAAAQEACDSTAGNGSTGAMAMIRPMRLSSDAAFGAADYNLLHEAAEFGSRDVVQAWIVAQADCHVDCPWPGSGALHYACSHGNLSVAKLLIANDADVNRQNCEGSTPLHYAVFKQNMGIINLLLEKGGRASLETQGKSVLWNHALTPTALAKVMKEEVAIRARNIMAALDTKI